MEQKIYDAAAKLPEPKLAFSDIQSPPKFSPFHRTWRVTASLAACFVLLFMIGFVSVEAKEYTDAINFFNNYGLSTDGLSRGEIKAVYRDITTRSFSYSKTEEVLVDAISEKHIGGYELLQDSPIELLWHYVCNPDDVLITSPTGIHYKYRSEYIKDAQLGFNVHDKSFLEKYDGDSLLWSISISEFLINGYNTVSDGVIVYGETPIWNSSQASYAWIAKIDHNGTLLWKHILNDEFENENVSKIIENKDGSYSVFSNGDFKYLCLYNYTKNGVKTVYHSSDIGNYRIWNVAPFSNGYIVHLGSYVTDEYSKIVKVDHEGNVIEMFSYSADDAYYYITDMMEYNEKIYLSAYSVPKSADEDEDEHTDSNEEIALIKNYIYVNGIEDISSEELTPMVRNNYTALLLVCEPNEGTPQEFYSAKGSLGDKLSLSDSGMLMWDVDSIVETSYSPYTSAFSITGVSYVFRYTFDSTGTLVSQEKTGKIVPYVDVRSYREVLSMRYS